jgi:hypothetical protein
MKPLLRIFNSNACLAVIVAPLLSALIATPSLAATIKVEFDDNAGGKNDGARGRGAVGDANFGANAPFSSRGFEADPTKPGSKKGSLIRNASGKVLKDLHLKLTSAGDTFDPASTGGGAFPNVMLSADKKEIWFDGGNIKPGEDVYSFIPKSADFIGGVGKYEGRATAPPPPPPPKKDEKKQSVAPKAGNDVNPQIAYDGAGGFVAQLGNINFAEYRDGTVVTANSVTESIIGSTLTLSPMALIGPSPDLSGAFRLTDALLFIESGQDVFLSATFGDMLLIPDTSVPGFDSLLQGTFRWAESLAGLNSRFLDEFYSSMTGGPDGLFNFHTNLLGVTDNLTQSGVSSGIVDTNGAVPEPSTFTLLCLGTIGLFGDAWRRRKRVQRES